MGSPFSGSGTPMTCVDVGWMARLLPQDGEPANFKVNEKSKESEERLRDEVLPDLMRNEVDASSKDHRQTPSMKQGVSQAQEIPDPFG